MPTASRDLPASFLRQSCANSIGIPNEISQDCRRILKDELVID